MKKTMILIMLLFSFLSWNCFGRFAIIRKLYKFVDGISVSDTSPMFNKVVKSAIAWLVYVFPFIGGLAFFADFCVINLIEFWTDENPIDGKDDSSFKKNIKKTEEASSKLPAIQSGKTIVFESAENGLKLYISKSDDGNELRFRSAYQNSTREIVAFKNEPGILYTNNNDSLTPIEIELDTSGRIMGLTLENNSIPVDSY